MSNKKLLHFDVADGTLNYDPNYGGYHAYNATIKLMNTLHKVKKISLKSLEMPVMFNNIRSASENTSSVLYLQFTYASYTNIQIPIYIPPMNYTSISLLLSFINTQLSNNLASYGLTITAAVFSNSITYQTYIQFTCNQSTAVWFFYRDSILLSGILGVLPSARSYSSPSITNLDGKNMYCLNVDNYICLYLNNIPAASSNASGRNCSFKVPLSAINGQIQFTGDNNQFGQVVEIQDPNFTLSQISITVYDRYGYAINGGNFNYSFSLLFEYDDLF